MKKFLLSVAVAVAATSLVGCDGISTNDSRSLNNSVDTLSLKMGQMYGYGMAEQFGRDSSFSKSEFMRGLEMALSIDDTKESYRQGVMVGLQLGEMLKGLNDRNGVQLNSDVLYAEFKRAFMADSTISPMMLQGEVNMLMQKEMQAAKERDPQAIANKEAGKQFIDSIVAADPEVRRTESGLAYKVITPGNGQTFKTTDRIMTKYKGTKIDGTVFDERQEPLAMSPTGVVKGFKEGLLMMSPGAKYILYIPGELAYGVDGGGPIGLNETLIFELETVGLEAKK